MFDSLLKLVFGRFTLESLTFLHEPILLVTFIVVVTGGALILAAVTWFGLWEIGRASCRERVSSPV